MEEIIEPVERRPMWRRIVDFPLAALLIGVIVFACIVAVGGLFQSLHPKMPKLEFRALFTALNVALAFAGYKLVLRHLGEQPRDDLRFGGAAKELGLGLLIGLVLFSGVVGVAALFGSTASLPVAAQASSRSFCLMPGSWPQCLRSSYFAASSSDGSKNLPEAGPLCW